MAIVVTPGAADANSYCSIAQADAYHAGHVSKGTWDDGDDELKEAALVQATRMLDAHMAWMGTATTSTQALGWPRYGGFSRNNYLLDHAAIPVDVINATAEFARQLLAGDRAADSDVEVAGLRRIQAGPVALEFNAQVLGKPVPDAVFFLIRHLGTIESTRGGAGTIDLVRA